ncbi:MAG: SCO6745 family protein [Acidimicrobiales bacterium]
MGPDDARRLWRALETYHGMIYFAPEAAEEYEGVGLEPGPMGYFASRSAPMGAVRGEVVVATFYNFEPSLVLSVVPRAWSLATPEVVLDARLRAADRALRRMLGDDVVGGRDVEEAAVLARAAAEACAPHGRPLFAGHASLPYPDEAHLVLWHAASLLREFRGDGHIASLVTHGIGPLTALVLHAGTGLVPPALLRATRAWPDKAWEAEVARQQVEGMIDAQGALTAEGAAWRGEVDAETDAAAVAPYAHLGVDGCARLREIGKRLSTVIAASGAFPRR